MADLNVGLACQFAKWDHFAKWTYIFPGCTRAAQAYQANMERAHGILMLPGYAFMSGEQWQSCTTAAVQHFFGDARPSDEEFERRHGEMNELAAALRKEALTKIPPESRTNSFRSACYNIEVFANEFPRLRDWLHDTLKTSVIQAWTAFEVLAEDLWKYVIAERPQLDARTKDEIRLSGHRSRRKIANLYRFTFRMDNVDILNSVDNTKVHALAIARNVLVHSGGNIDTWFNKDRQGIPELDCITEKDEGYAIQFSGELVRGLIDPVTPLGFGLVKSVDGWLTSHL
jgi:hypothetical protein